MNFLFPAILNAQTDSLYEVLSESQEEDDGFAEIMEELILNPLDINFASTEDLQVFPFLSTSQIDSLIQNRPFNQKRQIRIVLGKETYKLFRPFFVIKPIPPDISFQMTQRVQLPLNKVKGLRTGKFSGTEYENYSKFRFASGRKITGGLLTQKDLGESNTLDHYSGFLQWTDTNNRYKIILGNYQVQFGHGLAFSSPYSIHKSVFSLAPLRVRNISGRPYISSSESSGFTGLFVNYSGTDYITFDLFYSNSLRDATFDPNSTLITGLDYSGYHRTNSEIDKKDLLKEEVIGSHTNFKIFEFFNVGLIYSHIDFNPAIVFDQQTQSENSLRRDFYRFSSDHLNMYSVSFNTHLQSISITGEIASNDLNKFSQSFNILLQQKNSGIGFKWWHIPAQFQSPFGRSFANSQAFPQGKQGFYAGVKHILLNRIKITSYWTTEKKLWRTYFDPLPTTSKDFLININFSPIDKTELALKYIFSSDQIYTSDFQNSFNEYKRKFRLDFIKHITKEIRLRSRVEKIFVNYSEHFSEKQGINFYQDIRCQFFPIVTLNARYSSFETADYDSRIYEFENDLPGTFSNYALYSRGSKWYLMLKLELWDKLQFWLKYRYIYFDGVETIGSGDMEIEGNTRKDVRIQFSYSY
ncbi:hypothetical protein ACFLSX_03995 [Calditrichota bacterium]